PTLFPYTTLFRSPTTNDKADDRRLTTDDQRHVFSKPNLDHPAATSPRRDAHDLLRQEAAEANRQRCLRRSRSPRFRDVVRRGLAVHPCLQRGPALRESDVHV